MTDNESRMLTERVDRFRRRLGARVLCETAPLELVWRVAAGPLSFSNRPRGRYGVIREGEAWGKAWDSAWFHVTGVAPRSWKGRRLVADLDFNGEGLVFDKSGHPIQGITNGSVFDKRHSRSIVDLADPCRGGERVDLWVEAVCHGLMGLSRKPDPPRDAPDRHGVYVGVVNRARMCVMDETVWQLWIDVGVLAGLLKALHPESVRHARILRGVNAMIDAFADDPERAGSCRDMLTPLFEQPAHASALRVTAVGHAHIDTGWLWPVREAVRKCARTFSSQLRLIERYPDYVFGASQPQHYAFIKESYPEIFEAIRRAVKAGRWECQGGMWVEADCNLISGESMVRQFLHGKNFFRDAFGVEVRNLWLPDVFGYSAAMPQIMKQAGCDTFVTQKLSWSQFNRFPHTTFRWRGIDGTEVLTHFPPEDTYNGLLTPVSLAKGDRQFQERGFMDGYLSLFGIGDGGGGPTDEHIAFGLRQANLEGVPRVRFGAASGFLEHLETYREALPVWNGELYLELHRGTLTTQARAKRGNRMLENRLRQVEWLWSALPLEQYPAAELDRLWKTLLLHQFHDILPGSSIAKVYEDTLRDYAQCFDVCERLTRKAARRLFKRRKDSVTLVNVLSYDWARPVELPADWGDAGAVDERGDPVAVQLENGRAVAAPVVPAQGAVTLTKSGRATKALRRGELVLENAAIRYEFSEAGVLERIVDKEVQREVLAENGSGNVLSLYEDRANNWDAWDIDFFYEGQLLETARAVKAARLPSGPVRQGLRFQLAIGRSEIEQDVFLASGSKRLEFQTRVLWRERHRMLRVAFPVAVRAERFSADIQYGYVERATHRNTPWDKAKFEVAAHRYVDLCDHDYGVALLNDCKYGHKVHDNVLDLNLLRSPTHPDPDADQGEHTFVYALLPHTGGLVDSDVMAEAAALNVPALRFDNLARRETSAFPVRLEGRGVSLEVVKKAEKDDALIVRLVETEGRTSPCRLHVGEPFGNVTETNLMEWTEGRKLAGAAGWLDLQLKPFEIRTYKVGKV